MAIPKRKLVALCLSVVLITGCTSVKVIRNPAENDTGIRFYRPKPYLLVTPADPTGRLVNMKLEYLPDFNEEYSAHLKGKASLALKDGWNVVGVNTKEAPAEKEAPPAKIEDIKLPAAVVSATNVPMGYYESVYGMAGSRKFLQGWRYIGMTILTGGQPNVCTVPGHDPKCPPGGAGTNGCITGPLYGMVFFNGVMTFRQLDEIANNQLCPMFVNPAPPEAAPVKPASPEPGGLENNTPAPKPGLENNLPGQPLPAPPTPSPSPSGSVSLSRPKVTPALVVVKPASAPISPALSKPTLTPMPTATSVSKPIASKSVYTPIAKKPVVVPTITASNLPKATPPKNVVATPPNLDQDPLLAVPPSFDQDLFRTGSSPRP